MVRLRYQAHLTTHLSFLHPQQGRGCASSCADTQRAALLPTCHFHLSYEPSVRTLRTQSCKCAGTSCTERCVLLLLLLLKTHRHTHIHTDRQKTKLLSCETLGWKSHKFHEYLHFCSIFNVNPVSGSLLMLLSCFMKAVKQFQYDKAATEINKYIKIKKN